MIVWLPVFGACAGMPPDDTSTETGPGPDPVDADVDGADASVDCDDADATVNPASELRVAAGRFLRGRDDGTDAAPEREITMSAFCLDTFEVTNAAFVDFLAGRAAAGLTNVDDEGRVLYDFEDDDDDVPARILDDGGGAYAVLGGYEDHPVTEVYHWSALAYCASRGKTLPTEAQWEAAARGSENRTWPWGEEPPACVLGNLHPGPEGVGPDGEAVEPCVDDTTRVGSYPDHPGPYGHLDLAGNVAEWALDWYQFDYYATSPDTDPAGPDTGWSESFPDGAGEARVTRGGSFASNELSLGTSSRYVERSTGTSNGVGFRCARPW